MTHGRRNGMKNLLIERMVGRPPVQRKRGPGPRRAIQLALEPVAPLSARRDNARVGEVAEWLNAAVLKTVDPQGFGGSNPSLSANLPRHAWPAGTMQLRGPT